MPHELGYTNTVSVNATWVRAHKQWFDELSVEWCLLCIEHKEDTVQMCYPDTQSSDSDAIPTWLLCSNSPFWAILRVGKMSATGSTSTISCESTSTTSCGSTSSASCRQWKSQKQWDDWWHLVHVFFNSSRNYLDKGWVSKQKKHRQYTQIRNEIKTG